ncbi:MAG TPA: ABC transporter permease [Micromonosporaceae bacterium]|nr:ABC transporter permease [Micromonosporaceae bacterium]
MVHLDDIFDDPAYGEPGRDRMVVHLVWEALLAAAVLVVGYLLHRAAPGELRSTGLTDLLLVATVLGLATMGVALSLRTGAVNLAVGPVAYASAVVFAQQADRGLTAAALTTVGMALAAGAALAVAVVGLHVPGWAASLALALAAIAWIGADRPVAAVPGDMYQPERHGPYWFAGFVALSLLGGALGTVKAVRRGTGRYRPGIDPAHRRGRAVVGPVVGALIASTGLAAAAGVLQVLGAARTDPTETGLPLTGLALGAALLGGTSAFGRRGGVTGTVLAVVGLVLLLRYAAVQDWPVSRLGLAAAAIGVGLAVTRLVERFGRPPGAGGYPEPVAEPPPGWVPLAGAGEPETGPDGPWSSPSGGWTSPLPARTTGQGWRGARRRPDR